MSMICKGLHPFSQRKKQSGFIAAEFIFALTIAIGVSIVFFALNFTLSMVEVSQYIAFSTARAHAAADLNPSEQAASATAKFESLINNPVLKPLLNSPDSGWFEVGNLDIRGPTNDFTDSYPTSRIPQVGIRFDFKPKILSMRIALLGKTSNPDGNGYAAKITGLLIREPTFEECFEGQVKQRYENIVRIDPRFQDLAKETRDYIPLEDNGC